MVFDPERVTIVDVTDEVDVRSDPAVRRPLVRPSIVRLLGGRRPGVEGDPPRRGSSRDGPIPKKPSDRPTPANPFLADLEERSANPFARPGTGAGAFNPFLDDDDAADDNPFAPRPPARPTVGDTAYPKLRLLGRGLAVAGSYAKVLLVDDVPAAYCQFGPLTAYPRAQRTRDLYPALPDSPLPAVITCIASTADARDARPGADARRGRLRRPRTARVRGRRDLSGDRREARCHQRRDARRSGSRSGSSSPRRTSGSRSCAASWREPADPRRDGRRRSHWSPWSSSPVASRRGPRRARTPRRPHRRRRHRARRRAPAPRPPGRVRRPPASSVDPSLLGRPARRGRRRAAPT